MTKFRLLFYRLTHWEYWPMEYIYFPLFPVWIYFAIRSRSLFFFNAANPSIKNGGMAMESKKEIYDIIPGEYIPKTILFNTNATPEDIIASAKGHAIKLPFIIKPDVGMKGLGVQIVESEIELDGYLKNSKNDFLVQEFISFKKEVGIFYARMPGEEQGQITGIVYKDFLSVLGNGESTLLELIKKNPRSYFQLAALKKMYGEKLKKVLRKNEKLTLVPYGSHTRGAQFIDITHQVNSQLLETMNSICKKIDGFYFGRLDVMYNNWEELCAGKNFSIIELNGAGSEPTHIYDPSHSLFFAWKEIIRHWYLLYKISAINFKMGHPYLSFTEGKAMYKSNNELETRLRAF